jgi:hypothetical protein
MDQLRIYDSVLGSSDVYNLSIEGASAPTPTATPTTTTTTAAPGSMTLVRQGSYGVSGTGTSSSPWRVTTSPQGGAIPTWRVTGTLTVRFAFQNHQNDYYGWVSSSEYVYKSTTDPILQKNDGRSVAGIGAVLVESGRNKTVDVVLTDCYFYMRRQNDWWGPCVEPNGDWNDEGQPSVQFFVL